MKFGIIGHPVAGSLSPLLFSAAYDGRHSYDLLDFEHFAPAWEAFLSGYQGVNVTAPFKQDAFAAVDVLSENARLTGAVNLVVKQADGSLYGHNTDVDGVVGSVLEAGFAPADALVVGTGGAARAAIVAALRLGCDVTVAGRSLEKAQALAAEFGCRGTDLAAAAPLRPQLILYTLPGSAPAPQLGYASAIVLEAEYKHPALAAVPCRAYLGGRRWLLHQAAAGYALFTGEEPSFEKMSRAL